MMGDGEAKMKENLCNPLICAITCEAKKGIK
jgi:hypothetical protein